MTTQESTQTRQATPRSRWSGTLVAVVAVVVVVGVAVVAWLIANQGPVAADEAQVEMTYSGDGVSYTGDREIIEGTITVTFVNESDTVPGIAVWGYETGSDALAEELAFAEEGEMAVPGTALPVAGYDLEFETGDLVPGTTTWTMDLGPGTYIFDVLPDNFTTTGLWRAAVIEVVAE